jgi:hypothetical protein
MSQKRSDFRLLLLKIFPIFIELLVGHWAFIIPVVGRVSQNNPRIIAIVFQQKAKI